MTASEDEWAAQWLRGHGKVLSTEGERVAGLVHWVFDGIYHQQDSVLKADWSTFYVRLNLSTSANLATWDFNTLTRLVVGAHDRCIRVDIEPCNMRFLRVLFHPRDARTGSSIRRHPTMEDHLALIPRFAYLTEVAA